MRSPGKALSLQMVVLAVALMTFSAMDCRTGNWASAASVLEVYVRNSSAADFATDSGVTVPLGQSRFYRRFTSSDSMEPAYRFDVVRGQKALARIMYRAQSVPANGQNVTIDVTESPAGNFYASCDGTAWIQILGVTQL